MACAHGRVYNLRMLYKVLADIAVLIHSLWVAFLLFGFIWGRKSKVVRNLHLGGLLFAMFLQLMGWYCPLTHLEYWLRQRYAPGMGYPGSFIAHYLEELIYVSLTMRQLFLFTLALSAGILWGYFGKRRTKN